MHVLRQTGICVCRTGTVCGFVLVTLLTLGGTLARGQAANTGSIYGSVTDPSGAVIVGAAVVVTDPDKGVSRTQKTSKSGEYTISSLPVGVYTLTVTADGFQTYVAESITVDADKSAKIAAKMVVGNKDVTVNVDAEGATLDTRSATIGTMIDNKLVEELPLDGNNAVGLAALLPGVTDLNAPATNTSDRGGPTYSVSGSRNTQNLMLFDGLMWNNLFFNTGINYPPTHALQEISVLLNNFKAQYGRNAGSVFNVITKSGSNQLHFIAWDYVENKAFNAADYLSHVNPADTSNQFGITLTGPIKRDRAYYALTFQQLIQSLEATGTVTNQGPQERGLTLSGTPFPCSNPGPFVGMNCASFLTDVTGLTNNVVTYNKLTNPELITSSSGNAASPTDTENMLNSAWAQAGNTGQNPCIAELVNAGQYAATHNYYDGKLEPTYMPNAEFPVNCLNPVITNVFNHYNPIGVIGPGSATFQNIVTSTTVAPQPKHDANALARIDWKVNDRHTIDARYNLIHADDQTSPGVNSASQGVSTYELQNNVAVSNFGNIGEQWIISPNMLNTVRLGYKRYVLDTPPLDHHTLNDFGGNFVEPGTPTMPVLSASGFALGSTSQGNSHVVNENEELLEQLSWTHGNHTYQFGVNFLRLQYLNRQDYPGQLSFSTTFTGLSLADESLGLLSSVQANSPLVQAGINHSVFMYAQDDWRATSKLTLNLGVRYELPFQWYQPTGYSSTFRPGVQSTVFPNAIAGLAFPGDKGVLNSLVPTDFNGMVPRLGLAYDVYGSGRFVLRAGFGMFFDAINANVVGVGEPFYFQVHATLPPGGASVPLAGLGPNQSLEVIPSGFNKANPQFQAPYSLFYPDRNFRTPYYEGMNAGFEYRVTRGGVLDVNYVGKLGRKLTIPFDQNPAIYDCTGGYFQADPVKYCTGASSSSLSTRARLRYSPFNFGGGGLVDFASIGTSNYNSLQAQYTQRGGRTLLLLASYTYSKAIDLQTQSQTTSNAIPDVFDVTSERGLSDFDARQTLSMGWLLTPPQNRTGSGFVKTLVNNWEFGGVFLAHSGKPYSVTINNDSALDGEPNQRAAILPGRSPYLPKNRHRKDKVNEYFNVDAFTYPTIGTFSPMQRNSFIGPGYLLTDMNIGRVIPLSGVHEGMRVEVRADAFNVFNTPNLANPAATFSCSSTSIETVGNQNYGHGCRDIVNVTSNGVTTPTPIGALSSTFGLVRSTFGNNANTSTNGRKMQFSFTVFY